MLLNISIAKINSTGLVKVLNEKDKREKANIVIRHKTLNIELSDEENKKWNYNV